MNQLPVEIITKILVLACFDDKATGCSLTLTSKWFGNIVKPVRFAAVSLCGLSQISQFASMLEKLPPNLRDIKHLFVSGFSRKEAEEHRLARELEMRNRAVQHKLVSKTAQDEWDDAHSVGQPGSSHFGEDNYIYYPSAAERKEKQAAFDNAFYGVVRQAASSIRTLFVTTTFGSSPTFPPFPMPNLIDFSKTDSCSCAFALPRTFPKLRRIHTDSCMDHNECPIDFRTNAPALEELRVTSTSELSWQFVDALVNHARCMEVGNTDGFLFTDIMKRVILQQCPPHCEAFYGSSYMQHDSFARHLLRTANSLIESEDRGTGFRLVVLEMLDAAFWLNGQVDGLHYTFDDARGDWQDIISGDGKGCWNDFSAVDHTKYLSFD